MSPTALVAGGRDLRERDVSRVFAQAQSMAHADGVLFHAKTHSVRDFPRERPPKAKYMLVSLEQLHYAPLLKNAKYMAPSSVLRQSAF